MHLSQVSSDPRRFLVGHPVALRFLNGYAPFWYFLMSHWVSLGSCLDQKFRFGVDEFSPLLAIVTAIVIIAARRIDLYQGGTN
jgi:hypothetical protein